MIKFMFLELVTKQDEMSFRVPNLLDWLPLSRDHRLKSKTQCTVNYSATV